MAHLQDSQEILKQKDCPMIEITSNATRRTAIRRAHKERADAFARIWHRVRHPFGR